MEMIESWGRFSRVAEPGFSCVWCCFGQGVAGRLSTQLQHQVWAGAWLSRGPARSVAARVWAERRRPAGVATCPPNLAAAAGAVTACCTALCLLPARRRCSASARQRMACSLSWWCGQRLGCSVGLQRCAVSWRGLSPRTLQPSALPRLHTLAQRCPPLLRCSGGAPLVPPQFSVQYRVAPGRQYQAFYSLADPAAQVTSYGALRGCRAWQQLRRLGPQRQGQQQAAMLW